jgi:DNA polymerase sigma
LYKKVAIMSWELQGDDDSPPMLWLAQEPRKLPLLQSTRMLLNMLWVSIPDVDVQAASSSSSPAALDMVQVGKGIRPLDAATPCVDERAADTVGPKGAQRAPGEMEEKSAIPPENVSFQSLNRTRLTADMIMKALLHIEKFHRDDTPKKKNHHRSDTQRHLLALEHQRDRLQQRQQQLLLVEKEGVSRPDDENADSFGEISDDNPWIHLASVLNSLCIITPILLRMLLHPRRNDDSLVIQQARLQRSTKRPTCWLIGDLVFDSCRVHTCKQMFRNVVQIFASFRISEKDLSNSAWCHGMRAIMKDVSLHLTATASPTNCNLTQYLPFWDMPEQERVAAEELAAAYDKKFGLQGVKDADEHVCYLQAVHALHAHISKLIQDVYPDATLSIYGSCLSDLSLGKSSDVDISIYIKQTQRLKESFQKGLLGVSKYEREMKNTVFKVCRILERRRHEFRDVNPVTRARVPVVNGTYAKAMNPHSADGSLTFDICFLNDIAVANSSLLREYSLVDSRSKNLMIAVKRWAKDHNISSAKQNTFSSYTWMNMVVFYLQSIGFLPNLQNMGLMDKAGVSLGEDRWRSINSLDTRYVKWEHACSFWAQPTELAPLSVTSLLYGFFRFYSRQFRSSVYLISIKRAHDALLPKSVFRTHSSGFVIEDPFENYDSHCPHNLAGHASKDGMSKIIRCLNAAEGYLRGVFLRSDLSIESLWPLERSNVGSTAQTKMGTNIRQQSKAKKNKKVEAEQRKTESNKGKAFHHGRTNMYTGSTRETADKKWRNDCDAIHGDTHKQPPKEESSGSSTQEGDREDVEEGGGSSAQRQLKAVLQERTERPSPSTVSETADTKGLASNGDEIRAVTENEENSGSAEKEGEQHDVVKSANSSRPPWQEGEGCQGCSIEVLDGSEKVLEASKQQQAEDDKYAQRRRRRGRGRQRKSTEAKNGTLTQENVASPNEHGDQYQADQKIASTRKRKGRGRRGISTNTKSEAPITVLSEAPSTVLSEEKEVIDVGPAVVAKLVTETGAKRAPKAGIASGGASNPTKNRQGGQRGTRKDNPTKDDKSAQRRRRRGRGRQGKSTEAKNGSRTPENVAPPNEHGD